jgi:adenosylcobyric acid synthase
MPALMVQGVSSDAGKSFVVTALCRWLRRQGVSVAPFKAQNMSNNARVVVGGEIGSAQWLQALAAGAEPDLRMNPVLLKPESDTRSQVVVNGVADLELSNRPWRGRSVLLWPHVVAAYESLARDYDVVVIEGAGSPAETNLVASDIANMAVADLADAPVLLVADIDRGGAFAHLYGTWSLLAPAHQERVKGFVLNKFRGDPALLTPAPEDLESLCGVPTRAVLPWVDHALPDEEGPTPLAPRGAGPRVGVVFGPYASNLDEFVALQRSAQVRWIRSPRDLDEYGDLELLILPGSKHVAADLAWLEEVGLVPALRAHAERGTLLLGICGGLQMLGEHVESNVGAEGSARGLGLLPVTTTYDDVKRTRLTAMTFPDMGDSWSWLSGQRVEGYEIRFGETTPSGELSRTDRQLFFGNGNVLGVTFHGLFETPSVIASFGGRDVTSLECTFDVLADLVERHFDTTWLRGRLGLFSTGRSGGARKHAVAAPNTKASVDQFKVDQGGDAVDPGAASAPRDLSMALLAGFDALRNGRSSRGLTQLDERAN